MAFRERAAFSHNRPDAVESDTNATARPRRHGPVACRWPPAGVLARNAFRWRFVPANRVVAGIAAGLPNDVHSHPRASPARRFPVARVFLPTDGPPAAPGSGNGATRSGID